MQPAELYIVEENVGNGIIELQMRIRGNVFEYAADNEKSPAFDADFFIDRIVAPEIFSRHRLGDDDVIRIAESFFHTPLQKRKTEHREKRRIDDNAVLFVKRAPVIRKNESRHAIQPR